MKRDESNKIFAVAALLILGILFIAGMTVPISDKRDLYAKVTIKKPLIGDAKITNIEAYITGHTLLEAPALADILTSGTLKIAVESGDKRVLKAIGSVRRGGDATYTIVLRDIPPNYARATVKLTEDGKVVDTQYITFSTEGSK